MRNIRMAETNRNIAGHLADAAMSELDRSDYCSTERSRSTLQAVASPDPTPCVGCLDTGRCWICLGTGHVMSRSGVSDCRTCDGCGSCHVCRGASERMSTAGSTASSRQ
jgi:hypothetical protein